MFETPSTGSRVFSKTETFFSDYGYRSHVTGVFGHRKRTFSNTLSRVKIFENGDLSYSCERAKTRVFKYGDVMPRFQARSSAHTIRKRYVWTQILFKYGEKNLRFQKYSAMCGWSNTIQKRYVWTQVSFKYGGKNLRFRKYAATCRRGLRFKPGSH